MIDPPPGCQEIPGVILVVEVGKAWLRADGTVTEVWTERGVWPTEADAAAFLEGLACDD